MTEKTLHTQDKLKLKRKLKISYRCEFCEKDFPTMEACARHIDNESVTGITFPTSIIMVIDGKKLGVSE